VHKTFTTLTRGKPEVILVVTELIYADVSPGARRPVWRSSGFATTTNALNEIGLGFRAMINTGNALVFTAFQWGTFHLDEESANRTSGTP
jgi:hypothetical protein